MTVKKLSVAIDETIAAAAAQAAEDAGLSLSAWLTRAAEHELRILRGLEGVREYEREHGAFTEEERQWADDIFNGVPGVTFDDPRVANRVPAVKKRKAS